MTRRRLVDTALVAALIAVMIAIALLLSGCMTIQPIEPVINPPGRYQGDTSVRVEFVHPALVGVRCAKRGAKIIGLPAINSAACSDTKLMTLPNPCFTLTGGWSARVLCHEMAHANGWEPNHAGGSYVKREDPILPTTMMPGKGAE
jgi:hypothetical protein